MSLSENLPKLRVPQRLATVPCMGATLLLLRKAATKVVRPRSDQGTQVKYTDDDRSKETEDRQLIPAITYFGHIDNSIAIVSQSQTVVFDMRVWLCMATIAEHLMVS